MRVPNHSARGGMPDTMLTPMIDVVFQLIIFFIWTSSFQVSEYSLPSRLSSATGTAPAPDKPPPEKDFADVVIRVALANGQPIWRINDAVLANLVELRTRLTAIAQIKRDAPVVLHPDDAVPLGDVIDAYDIARLAGFEKVQFAAP